MSKRESFKEKQEVNEEKRLYCDSLTRIHEKRRREKRTMGT